MRIGVVSDTHRNSEYLEKAVDLLVSRQKISTLYHLGDDYNDVKGLSEHYLEIVQVPGIYEEGYKNKTLPATVIENIQGVQILLVHSLEKDLDDDDLMNSDIILYGHTHKRELRLEDGKLFMNPGHLKGPLEKNMSPSFGLLTIMNREVTASVYDMKMNEISSMELLRSESGLYKSG